tara:strand:+ start:2927 stop:3430 length:504 start_codon:yes stop_codon:yes gene_type:complete
MGATSIGEYLGSAADISNTAQYTPTVRTLCMERKNEFIPEGTMVAFKGTNLPGGLRTDHKDIFVECKLHSVADNDYALKPLASDYDGTANTGAKQDFIAVAVSGVQQIKCPNNDKCGCAGEPVFVNMGGTGKPEFTFSRQDQGGRFLGYLVLRKTCEDEFMSVCLQP